MTTIKLNVKGMKCGGCENSLKEALATQPGVIAVKPSHKEATVVIDYDDASADLGTIKKMIADQGFTVAD